MLHLGGAGIQADEQAGFENQIHVDAWGGAISSSGGVEANSSDR
jgi:hypothetical protein